MRVIAGKARSLRLKTIEGMETRPTTDRIKETLFNMLSNQLYDCRFLDLFAGSGGIGIEAISRGAELAVFVEKNPKACAVIKDNLSFTHLSDHAKVINQDVFTALSRLEGEKPFDFIFMDPPYNLLLEKQVLEKLSNSSLVDENTIIIVEASLETDMSYIGNLGFEITKDKRYKTNKHIFLRGE